MKDIISRSYGGKLFRPSPETFQRDDDLLIVVTPWGPRESAKNLIETVNEHCISHENSMEVTSPFGWLTYLSPLGNWLRTALMIANNKLCSEENSYEYQSGVEILALWRDGEDLCLGHIGGPHVFIDRKGSNLIPLVSGWDLSTEMCVNHQLPPPLPKELAGIHQPANIHIMSMKLFEGDRIILLSRSYVPNAFYALSRDKRNLSGISQALAQSDPHCPFWLGVTS